MTLFMCPKRDYPMLSDEGVIIPLLTDELVKRGKGLIREGHSPQLINKVFKIVCLDMVIKKINDTAIRMKDSDMKDILSTFFDTQLPTKLFGLCRKHIAEIIVGAVYATGYDYEDSGPFDPTLSDFEDGFKLIGIIKVSGGSVGDSFLVKGIAFKSTASRVHGYEEPGVVKNPKILLLDRDDGYVIDKCVKHGPNVVLSCQAIDGDAKKKLAKRGIYFGDLVAEDYLDHVAAATRAELISFNHDYLRSIRIGTCKRFQQKEFGNELFGVFSGCPRGKTVTIVLRGDDQFIKEAEMYISSLIPYVRSVMKDHTLVAGGRSLYDDIIRHLSEEANNVDKDSKPIVKAFSKAIKTLSDKTCDNVGCNGVNNPSQKHAVALGEGGIVWEPPSLKIDAIRLATMLACIKIKYSRKGDGATSSKRKTKHTKKRKRC